MRAHVRWCGGGWRAATSSRTTSRSSVTRNSRRRRRRCSGITRQDRRRAGLSLQGRPLRRAASGLWTDAPVAGGVQEGVPQRAGSGTLSGVRRRHTRRTLNQVICASPLFSGSSRLAGRRPPRPARGGGGGNRVPAPRLPPRGSMRGASAARRGVDDSGGRVDCRPRTLAHGLQSGGWVSVQQSAMAVALALIGPGVWSIDARFLGWRRINIPASRTARGGLRSIRLTHTGSGSRPERARSCRSRPEERGADPAPG